MTGFIVDVERECHAERRRWISDNISFVCTAGRHTNEIVRLRSYSLSDEPDIPATICQAVLATSAATSFFDPVIIGDRAFTDGALGANNPINEVEGEASNIWCSETGDLKPLVKCFISIGTGSPGKEAFKDSMTKPLVKTLVEIATETENTAMRFKARWAYGFSENRYFRFSVDQGLQSIGLYEYNQMGLIEAATAQYLNRTVQMFRIRDCIRNLILKHSVYIADATTPSS
jgi:predicted acylesterase/phospholipase RssA